MHRNIQVIPAALTNLEAQSWPKKVHILQVDMHQQSKFMIDSACMSIFLDQVHDYMYKVPSSWSM